MSPVRVSRFILYMVVFGAFGVFLSFLVPIMKYSVSDDLVQNPYYDPVWLGAIGLTLIPGAIILLAKRTDYLTAGIMYSIVGVGSLVFFLVAYFR